MLVQQYSMLMLVSLFIKWKKEAKAMFTDTCLFLGKKQPKDFGPMARK
jgi:hypothetical protein